MPPFIPENGREKRFRDAYPNYNKGILADISNRLATERLHMDREGFITGLEADAYLIRSLKEDISKFDSQVSAFSRKKENAEAEVMRIIQSSEYVEEKAKFDALWKDKEKDPGYVAALGSLDERLGVSVPKSNLKEVINELDTWGAKKDSSSVALEIYYERFTEEKKKVQNRRSLVLAGTAAAGLLLGMLGGFWGASKVYSGKDQEIDHILSEKAELLTKYSDVIQMEKKEEAKNAVLQSSNTALSGQYQAALSSMTALGAKKPVNPLWMCDMRKLDVVSGSHFESYDRFSLESESLSQKSSFSDKVHGCMRRQYLEDVLKSNLPSNVWSAKDSLEFAHRKSQISYSAGSLKIITKNGTRTVAIPLESGEGIRSAYSNDFK